VSAEADQENPGPVARDAAKEINDQPDQADEDDVQARIM